jgi:C1A family cysteine protease
MHAVLRPSLPLLLALTLVSPVSHASADGAASAADLVAEAAPRPTARPTARPATAPATHVRVVVDKVPPLLSPAEEAAIATKNPRKIYEAAKRGEKSRARASASFVEANPEAKAATVFKNKIAVKVGSHFSWREQGMTTPAKNQKSYGTCWAFGAAGLMEAAWMRRHREALDLSEQDLINCNCRACDGSSVEQHGEKRLKGIRPESANLYVGDGNKDPCTAAVLDNCGPCDLANGTPFRLEEMVPVDPKYTDDDAYALEPVPVATMKAALKAYGPLYVKMHIPQGSTIGSHTGKGVFNETVPLVYEPKRNNGAHMVLITGWDDNAQAWEFKNSWGTGWGDDGFGWIKYGSNKIGMGAHRARAYAPDHRITAVWRKASAAEIQAHGWDYKSYRARYDELWPKGWRLHDLEVNVHGDDVHYNAVWRKGAVPEKQVYGYTFADYQKKYDELWKQGWRIHMLQPYVKAGKVRYTAVWRKGTQAEVQLYGLEWAAHKKEYDKLWKQGWRIHLLSQYVVGGKVKYDAVWRKSTSAEVQLYGVSYSDYRKKYDELWPQGWRLLVLDNYVVGGKVKYTAIWRPSTAAEVQVYGWDYDAFRLKDEDLRKSGWRLQMLEAY